ncbi:MAG: serine/threonine-protein kinase [Polyangiales bacterium]
MLRRDLKPPNIFVVKGVGGQLEPKVLDFGIAKPLDEQASVLTMNQTASVLGTPEYMAPEQLRETREPDARTDIYALGCILYEMLAGDRAFRATSYIELLQQVSTGKVTPLRDRISSVPGELERIVSRAMSLDPEARYSSAEAFGNALLEWASDIGRARWSGSFVAFRDPSLPPPEPAPSAVQITANAQPVSPVMATGPGAVLSDSLPPSQVPTDSFPAVAPPSTAPPNNAHVIRLGVMLLSVGVLLLGAALLALALR